MYNGSEIVEAGNVTIPPNHDIPTPSSVVEVRYLYAFRQSGAVYQPCYLGEREDIESSECTVNYRAQREFLALGARLETQGVSARKKLHELRKECGAAIANSLGIFAVSRALRHADIRTTSQYYADKKVRITTGLDVLLK